MKINRAYKTKLSLTRQQINYFKQCGRVARTVFNWCLRDYMSDYEQYYQVFSPFLKHLRDRGAIPEGRLSDEDWDTVFREAKAQGIDLPKRPRSGGRGARKKKLNGIKKADPKLAKITNYPYVILQSAVDDFDAAVQRYEEKRKTGAVDRKIAEMNSTTLKAARYRKRIAKLLAKGRIGNELDPFFPSFKSRHDDCRFRFEGNTVKLSPDGNSIKLPKIPWLIRFAETGYIPANPKRICRVAISQDRDDWYISVTVEEEITPPETKPVTLGVSIGVIDTAATSAGIYYENPRFYDKFAKKKAQLQAELTRRGQRDENGNLTNRTSNWKKTKAKLSRLERKIANSRKHHLHNVSKAITETLPSTIVVKDMDVQAMMQADKPASRHLNRRMADAGMGELRRQIEYKAGWNGATVEASKEAVAEICSVCGKPSATINYTTKMMTCPCGHTQRASVNMAINLSRKEINHA